MLLSTSAVFSTLPSWTPPSTAFNSRLWHAVLPRHGACCDNPHTPFRLDNALLCSKPQHKHFSNWTVRDIQIDWNTTKLDQCREASQGECSEPVRPETAVIRPTTAAYWNLPKSTQTLSNLLESSGTLLIKNNVLFSKDSEASWFFISLISELIVNTASL